MMSQVGGPGAGPARHQSTWSAQVGGHCRAGSLLLLCQLCRGGEGGAEAGAVAPRDILLGSGASNSGGRQYHCYDLTPDTTDH